jgi:hypothetical protein
MSDEMVKASRGSAGRRVAFIVLAVVGIVAVGLGIKFGDPETIHRFASQI